MKRKYSALLLIVFALWLINSNVLVSKATGLVKVSFNEADHDLSDTAVSRGTEIEYRYRMYKGKLQYRRWNVTERKWIDKCWKYE